MALIECPKCGKEISYKAIRCPQCGIEVQKELAELREKEWQQMKKHRRRIIISTVSIVLVAAIAIVGYLYYIDALNSIPADYRKQTVNYLERCESAINKGDFNDADSCKKILKKRWFTKRQAERFDQIQKKANDVALNKVEQLLVELESNYSENGVKQVTSIINSNLIDSHETERLTTAKDKLVRIHIREMEKTLKIYKETKDSYQFGLIMKYNMSYMQTMAPHAQSTRVVEIIAEAEKIKKRIAEKRYLTQDLRMYGLHGPVKSFQTTVSRIDGPSRWDYNDEKEMYDIYFSQSLQFDTQGHFSNTIDGRFSTKDVAKKDGDRILEAKDYIEDFGFSISRQWSYYPNGLVKQSIFDGAENHEECNYFYNEDGELLKTETLSAAEGTERKTITTYSIEERDKYGNWTRQIAEVTEYEFWRNKKDYVQSAFRHEMYNRVISYY